MSLWVQDALGACIITNYKLNELKSGVSIPKKKKCKESKTIEKDVVREIIIAFYECAV